MRISEQPELLARTWDGNGALKILGEFANFTFSMDALLTLLVLSRPEVRSPHGTDGFEEKVHYCTTAQAS